MVRTVTINGYPLELRGDTYVVLVLHPQGRLSGELCAQLEHALDGLVDAGVVRAPGAAQLHFFKTADLPDKELLQSIVPPAQIDVLKPVLTVITRPERKPQLFDTMVRWREIAERLDLPLWEVAVQYEVDASGWTREAVVAHMRMLERSMYRQTHAAYEEDLVVPESPFKPDRTSAWKRYAASPRRVTGALMADTVKWAYGAGAGIPGVETVAGPMGSGGGYVHAALWAVKETRGYTDHDLLRGLFVAAGIGALAFTRTEPTGECIGCTGECGICGAMAAGGIAEMVGASPEVVERAASLSLQSAIGLPCDPIPGGFGQPCRSRIITATCMANVFVDLALSGHDAVLPLHEAIDVADDVGRQLSPELLCTSRGGACATPTARRQASAYRAWFEESEPADRPPGNLI
jgi:L-serine dehydratase